MKSVHPYVYCNIICNNQDTETLMDEWIEKVMCVCVYVKRETLCDFTYWYNLKKQRNQNKQTNKQTKRKPSQSPELIDTENRLLVTRHRRWAKRVKVVKM